MKNAPILLAATAAAFLTASVADARMVDPRRGPGRTVHPIDCSITVAFSSYGPGIDRATFGNVQRLLDADRGVRSVSRQVWGREGEVTLCARIPVNADIVRLLRRIRAMIPARPRGPIRVDAPGLRRY